MAQYANIHGRRRGRGLRPWLISAKMLGVALLIGGLAAMAAIAIGGPAPGDPAAWKLLAECVRWIVLPCVVCGGGLAVIAGLALWLQMPCVFLAMRWFRLKAALIVVLVPSMHLWGRSAALKLHQAIETPDSIREASAAWDKLAIVFIIAFFATFVIALFGRIKPRLGRPITPA